ncbi:MAG: hypothetical protein WBM40_24990, partial [Thiohalocapsa sp.]
DQASNPNRSRSACLMIQKEQAVENLASEAVDSLWKNLAAKVFPCFPTGKHGCSTPKIFNLYI